LKFCVFGFGWIKKNHNPKCLIIAIPVAPKETIEVLKKNECDDIVVITSPSSTFRSVSQYYQVFDPVSDEQVITIMQKRGCYNGFITKHY
jgi:putative phosphoribosyl transferase